MYRNANVYLLIGYLATWYNSCLLLCFSQKPFGYLCTWHSLQIILFKYVFLILSFIRSVANPDSVWVLSFMSIFSLLWNVTCFCKCAGISPQWWLFWNSQRPLPGGIATVDVQTFLYISGFCTKIVGFRAFPNE